MNTEPQTPLQPLDSVEDSEYSINDLKIKLNEVVWMFAASETTLKEAEDLSNELLRLFTENRHKHGHDGKFDGT